MTDAPRIKDDEVAWFMSVNTDYRLPPIERYRQLLAAFVAKRVPPRQEGIHWDVGATANAAGFNACREHVLKGTKT
tara:strand:- start:1297 stop:1524 length:228 start_codon:yes stop_codon:yes gene_type:complete